MRPALQPLKDKEGLVGAEIGVALGRNAIQMIEELDIAKLYLVDPFQHYVQNAQVFHPEEKFDEIVAGLDAAKGQTELVWMPMTSTDASRLVEDNSLDFVYIDGNHAYEFVRADIRAWWPKIKIGGHIGGHDYGHHDVPGVKKAVDELFKVTDNNKNYDWWVKKEENKLCSIEPDNWWVTKVK